MPDQNAAIALLNRIEVVLRQLERANRGTCPNCLQDVVKTGHQANCTLGQSLLEIEDWRRTSLPGGVDWT